MRVRIEVFENVHNRYVPLLLQSVPLEALDCHDRYSRVRLQASPDADPPIRDQD